MRVAPKLILITAAILFLASALYPPWVGTRQSQGKQQVVYVRMYAPVYAPPEARESTRPRLVERSAAGHRYRYEIIEYGVALDFGRLALEWLAIGATAALALLIAVKGAPAPGLPGKTDGAKQ